MGNTHVAVDVGGTFTDVCIFDESDGSTSVAKVPTSPDVIEGVVAGLRQTGIDLSNTVSFIHGTTVATNALITRNLPRAGMVTTKGFRDVVEIRRGNREDLWDVYKDVAEPHIKRRDRLTVTERVDYDGNIVTALDHDELREVAGILRERGVETVAVCFINAHANPVHELEARKVLEAEMPDATICTSNEILPELFEHERFSTAINNAVLAPLIGRYTNRLRTSMAAEGYTGDVLLMHSGGGVMTSELAESFAARLAVSGLAAGAIASRHIAMAAGFPDSIGFDMGGTSTDIALATNGELHTQKSWSVEFGYPIGFPSVDVTTVGAGGGSIAWLDEAGALRSGPQSAGATPGPASYGRGGKNPTTTDANLVLGRQSPQLAGGDMVLDLALATEAVKSAVADELGLELTKAAEAMVDVANANMADAVRLVTIRKGYDPRDFCLVAMGGAGPMHAVAVARDLSIPTVLVPPHPGITSAMGCLLVDVRHDFTQMMIAPAEEMPIEDLDAAFAGLEEQARERLQGEGIPEGQQEFVRTIDMQYKGQWRSITVPVPEVLSWTTLLESFYDEYEREHNFRREGTPVEMYRIGVCGIGRRDKPDLLSKAPGSVVNARIGSRSVIYSADLGPVDADVYDRSKLAVGDNFIGPAIVEQVDSTTLVHPGDRVLVDDRLNLRIEVAQERSAESPA